MHTIKDFCQQFNVSRNTMHTYLHDLKPFFKITGGQRKRIYTNEEAEIIIQHLKKVAPKLFKPKKKTLSHIIQEAETK